jgi:hypothetical protein
MKKLKNNRGADEANVDCVSYPRQADGSFLVPESVALQLLAVPAGFYRAAHDEPQPRNRFMDFLALTPTGDPAPHAQFHVGVGGRYEANEHGVVNDVLPNHAVHLLNSGAVPLPPAGWVDPRPVTIK